MIVYSFVSELDAKLAKKMLEKQMHEKYVCFREDGLWNVAPFGDVPHVKDGANLDIPTDREQAALEASARAWDWDDEEDDW